MLGGCATVNGTPTQPISVHTVDAQGHSIDMRCKLANESGDYFGNSPLRDVLIRRSASDLTIECRRGDKVARATAIARGSVLGAALLPGGSVAALVDHLSGYMYAYPRRLVLRAGEHLVFDGSASPSLAPEPGAAGLTADDLR